MVKDTSFCKSPTQSRLEVVRVRCKFWLVLTLSHFMSRLFLTVGPALLQWCQSYHQVQRLQPSIGFFIHSQDGGNSNPIINALFQITHSGSVSLIKPGQTQCSITILLALLDCGVHRLGPGICHLCMYFRVSRKAVSFFCGVCWMEGNWTRL